jgi:hypothetical protein
MPNVPGERRGCPERLPPGGDDVPDLLVVAHPPAEVRRYAELGRQRVHPGADGRSPVRWHRPVAVGQDAQRTVGPAGGTQEAGHPSDIIRP